MIEELFRKLIIIEEKVDRLYDKDDKLFTIKKAAKYCDMSEMSLYRAVKDGKLKPIKKTGKKLFSKNAIHRWLLG